MVDASPFTLKRFPPKSLNHLSPIPTPTMTPRTSYQPLHHAPQGVGGNNNLGIIIVRHTLTHKTFVEKRIRPSAIRSRDIHREIRIMQQVRKHANIVSIASFDLNYKTLGYGSVFMQHCTLGSLDALIGRYRRRAKFVSDEGFAWKVLWDLSIALAYLWTDQNALTVRRRAASGDVVPPKRGWDPIIHRDIKPSNVFMTWAASLDTCPYPTILLGDFGCAVTLRDGSARARLPRNDVEFAPPELTGYSGSGDVYALALTIVCVGWVKQSPPKRDLLNGWASEGMEMVLEKCLKRDQGRRPSPGELPKYV
jgi:serine/threonine protein kinase